MIDLYVDKTRVPETPETPEVTFSGKQGRIPETPETPAPPLGGGEYGKGIPGGV